MKNFEEKWTHLVSLARQAPDDRDALAPYGFATRMAAQAMAAPVRSGALFARFTLRALLVASLLMMASLAFNLVLPSGSEDDESGNVIDPVAEILSVS